MKTQRRHELQTNVLADWIGHKFEAVRPYLNTIGIAIAAGAVVLLVAAYFLRGRDAKISAGWEDYFFALAERDADRLETVAEDHPGSPAALWAKQSEADLELAKGIEGLFIDRNAARESLNRAKTRYEEVEEAAASQPLLLQRAQFGLAKLYESQSNVEKARKYYGVVAASTADVALSKQAQQRLELLKDPAVEKWYNWFARQKPAPPAQPSAPGGVQLPGNLGDLSDRPDIAVPGAAAPTATGGSSPAGEPAGQSPPPAAEPPASAAQTPPAASAPQPSPEPAPSPAPPAAPSDAAPSAAPPPGESPPAAAPAEPPAPTPEPAPAVPEPSATTPEPPPAVSEPSAATPPPAEQPAPPPPAELKPAGS